MRVRKNSEMQHQEQQTTIDIIRAVPFYHRLTVCRSSLCTRLQEEANGRQGKGFGLVWIWVKVGTLCRNHPSKCLSSFLLSVSKRGCGRINRVSVLREMQPKIRRTIKGVTRRSAERSTFMDCVDCVSWAAARATEPSCCTNTRLWVLSSAPLLDQQRCPHQRISVMSVFLYIVYLAHIFVLSGRSGPLGFIAPKREGGEGGYRIEGFIKMVPPRLLLLLLLFILHFECSCSGWWT